MSTVNEKMTAIADEIRTLSGTTGTMGLDSMATNLNASNTEVNEQTDLIAQIQNVLEGKASGGGNSSSGTFTLKIISDEPFNCIEQIFYQSNGVPSYWETDGMPSNEIVIENIDTNTYIIIDGGVLGGNEQSFTDTNISQNLISVYGNVILYCTQTNTTESITIMQY